MATITLTFVAGAQTFTHARTISAAHITRLLEAYRSRLGMAEATDEEVAQAIAVGFFNGVKANVLSAEREVQATTAADAVTEVTMT